jgi:putative DNA primase/helicase
MKARGLWPFPAVTGLINAPTLRPDGSLLQAEGYDKATGLLLINPPPMPWVNPRPTRAEAEAALATLKELLPEFPFVDDASRSVALSLIISTLVRGAVGQVPLHVLKAPVSGTGKSYLVDIASMIVTGARAAVVASTRNEDELEKRLVGEFIAGHTLISLDNLNGVLSSNLLCQAVTQDTMSIRALGSSNVVKIANRSVMVANGNNIAIADDLARRTLMAQLDASVERPWERSFSRNPVTMVAADRGRYIAAALTVVQGWLASGTNESPAPVNGFESWSRFVRDPLVWLGEADPVATMQAAREGDPRLQASIATLAAMVGLFGLGKDKARTMAQMIEATKLSFASIMAPEPKCKALEEALLAVAGVGKEIDQTKVGTWLRQTKGRIVGGLRLCSEMDKHLKVMRWWVEQVEE